METSPTQAFAHALKNPVLGTSNYEPELKDHLKPQRFKIVERMRIDSTLNQANPLLPHDPNANPSSERFETSAHSIGNQHATLVESKFAPQNVNKVLRFQSFYMESVDESNLEQVRLRMNTILLYLRDNTFEIIEPHAQNSGIPQGTFLKRCKLPKPEDDGEQHDHFGTIAGSKHYTTFYEPKDLFIGMDFIIFGRVFKIFDADPFTRKYYKDQFDADLAPAIPLPQDTYTLTREQITKLCGGDHGHFYGKKKFPLKTFMEASLGNPIRSRYQGEKKRKFLANNRKVLCFSCEHDERDKLYGDLMQFTLDYFLEDDTIEVKEVIKNNSGRDPFPLLLKRSRVLKKWKQVLTDEQDRGVEEPPPRESYYNEEDLYVGAVLDIFNRPMKLVDADAFTRDYYQVAWGLQMADSMRTVIEKEVFPKPDPPAYNGYGTEEDSLGSCNSLIPKPPKKDFKKMAQFDRMLLRFRGKMISTRKEQQLRRFVVTFYLADDTLSVYEPESRNSGMVCGKFLERGYYKRPDGKRYDLTDLAVGAQLIINGHRFELLEADEYTRKFLAA